MIMDRKAVQDYLIKCMSEVLPGNTNNVKIYENFFSRLSDEKFGELMGRMDSDDECFPFYHPNFSKDLIDLEHVIGLIEKEGGSIMEQLNITDPQTGLEYTTPIKYPVIMLPLRIQQQKLQKKMSVPKDNRHVDDMTNQPTSESKGAGVSYPEVQILYSMGLDLTLEELLKVRGGDEEAFRAYNNEIINTGGVKISTVSSSRTKVKSTSTVTAILKAMMFKTNLAA